MSSRLSLFVLSTALLASQTLAFSIAPAVNGVPSSCSVAAQRGVPLFMTESADDEAPTPEATAEDVVENVSEEAPEEEEDPELKALKDEISQLENTLKDKRRTLAGTRDKADEYTKTGYARKVAEMENMRRARSMLASSNKQGAVASTLAQFLPIYDKLSELNSAYEEDEFGKQYGALFTSIKQAFTDLGTAEYTVGEGDQVDSMRMAVIESEYSTAQPADTVLRVIRGGLELQGNVVRPAEVVASLGEEKEAEAPVEEEESSDEATD